jgi:hypothetical protein
VRWMTLRLVQAAGPNGLVARCGGPDRAVLSGIRRRGDLEV